MRWIQIILVILATLTLSCRQSQSPPASTVKPAAVPGPAGAPLPPSHEPADRPLAAAVVEANPAGTSPPTEPSGTAAGPAVTETDPPVTEVVPDDGDAAAPAEPPTMPAEVPLPVMAGTTIREVQRYQPEDGAEILAIDAGVPAPPAEVLDFYKEALGRLGMDVRQDEVDQNGYRQVVLTASSSTAQAMLIIERKPQADQTDVLISWTPGGAASGDPADVGTP